MLNRLIVVLLFRRLSSIILACIILFDSTLSLGKSNPIEVCEVLKGLKPNKATGCDLIPPGQVQQSAEVLSQPFSTLFNYNGNLSGSL